ncbi:MAG: nucleotidyltransferase domain-containing protein [Armatimonadota bacterium]|nr:nucleotidyltransferase domain-containing protein [Armatimonadota bacterium]
MDLDEALRQLRAELEELYGERLKGLYLFGSRARGDAEPDSDVDVAVVLDDFEYESDELTRMAPVLNRLSLECDLVFAAVPIRASEWAGGGSPLMLNLRREGVPLP